MKSKEKAKELVFECRFELYNNLPSLQSEIFKQCMNKAAKQCALIAVDEMIYYLEIILGVDKEDFKYWQEVKQEIELL